MDFPGITMVLADVLGTGGADGKLGDWTIIGEFRDGDAVLNDGDWMVGEEAAILKFEKSG